ncbi:hypothetical protein Tco_0576128 [Tanacetum coccineum]
MGIVVSTIHGAIKFHTKKGIGTVLLADKTDEGTKRARKILATNEERVLSCVNAEEKIIVNDKYPDQTVTIGKQLPEHFKKEYLIVPFQVFSIWKAFGGNTRDLGSFREETDKTTNLHQHLLRISTQKLETTSQITRDAVTTHLKTASQDLQTASDCMTQPII